MEVDGLHFDFQAQYYLSVGSLLSIHLSVAYSLSQSQKQDFNGRNRQVTQKE